MTRTTNARLAGLAFLAYIVTGISDLAADFQGHACSYRDSMNEEN